MIYREDGFFRFAALMKGKKRVLRARDFDFNQDNEADDLDGEAHRPKGFFSIPQPARHHLVQEIVRTNFDHMDVIGVAVAEGPKLYSAYAKTRVIPTSPLNDKFGGLLGSNGTGQILKRPLCNKFTPYHKRHTFV